MSRIRRLFTRRRLIVVGALLLVLLAAAVAGVETTSRSSFCNSCHIMNGFYDSWQADTHSQVQCVECHIAPGATNFVAAKLNGLGQVVDDWLNRTGTKPSASVSDFACTREGCHVLAKLDEGGDPDRPYFFKHAVHIDLEYRGIDMRCTTCHAHVMGSRHFEVTTGTCITCHINGHAAPPAAPAPPAAKPAKTAPSACTTCHAPPKGPIEHNGLTIEHDEYLRFGAACESCHRGATSPHEPVGDAQCLTCHYFGVERMPDVQELHRVHAQGEHKVECFNCHGVPAHGPVAQVMTLDIFDCRSCHQGQHDVQQQTYRSNGIAPAPGNGNAAASPHQAPHAATAVTPMFMAHVDCTGCHIDREPLGARPASAARVARAVPEACDACHRPGLGAQLVPLWQRSTHKLYDDVLALLPAAAGGEPAAIAEARGLLDLVRSDGSWGVHNPLYTQEILERARALVLGAAPPAAAAPAPAPAPAPDPPDEEPPR